jgi:pimeloyl-ACP methyl ester carboxylesterase
VKGLFHRGIGLAVDHLLCGSLALLHLRHAHRASNRHAVEQYLEECEGRTRAEHFGISERMRGFRRETPDVVTWESPAKFNSLFPANSRASAKLFRVDPAAPTVIMLHALMSASDTGYCRWAARFNSLGWNAVFVHLPFHYSRRLRGYLNGELCCTSDLVLTGDTLRQAVVEIRQLLAWLRAQGSCDFGMLATSYGGWVGAIVASLESDFRFIVLMSPLVNIVHALYEGPTSWILRRQLVRAGVDPSLVTRHAHLSSPLATRPAGEASQGTLLMGGTFDRIVRQSDLNALREAWPGAELLMLSQGHFGYGMVPRAFEWLCERELLGTSPPEVGAALTFSTES